MKTKYAECKCAWSPNVQECKWLIEKTCAGKVNGRK